jgi:hypothetical protein
MPDSILNSVKKVLGIDAEYDAFDVDILMHINSVFFTLNQLGIGPADGFMIEDDSVVWGAYLADDPNLNAVKSYMYLRVRLLFDPPSTSYLIEAFDKQRLELEWRLNLYREGTEWVDPDPEPEMA